MVNDMETITTKTKVGVNLWGAVIAMDNRKYTVVEALETKFEGEYIIQRWRIEET